MKFWVLLFNKNKLQGCLWLAKMYPIGLLFLIFLKMTFAILYLYGVKRNSQVPLFLECSPLNWNLCDIYQLRKIEPTAKNKLFKVQTGDKEMLRMIYCKT